MGIFRPSELFAFLEEIGAAPKKSLSQNFLIDGNILNKIADIAEVAENDHVLEIGAGPGALTEQLLSRGALVTAVEKDDRFAEALRRFPKLTVHNCDIRDFPLESVSPGIKFKVVANLPYQLTSEILNLLMPRLDLISSITVMVQEEVARKMTAKQGEEGYGALSVLMAYYAECRYGFKVSPRSFFPAPKVHSAVVHLKLKPAPIDGSSERFLHMIKMAFGQRRKMLKSSLKELYSKEVLEAALPSQTARPEELKLEDFILLYKKASLADRK